MIPIHEKIGKIKKKIGDTYRKKDTLLPIHVYEMIYSGEKKHCDGYIYANINTNDTFNENI